MNAALLTILLSGPHTSVVASGLPAAPTGFAYLTDSSGNYLVDSNGAYLIGAA